MKKTKYQLIADEIRKKILDGNYKLNTVIPSELQLQKTYDVSRHTVREAIGVLTNEGYLRKEKGSGTYVADTYKKEEVTSNKTKTIGVVTTYLSDYIFPSIIRGIEGQLRKEGYSLLLSSTSNNHAQERECLEKMLHNGVDGIIVEPTKSNQHNPNLDLYVAIKEQGLPLVMINAVYEELEMASICVDDVQSGFMAADALFKQGHQHLLFITKIDDLQGKYRMKGFVKACEQHETMFDAGDIITYTTETKDKLVAKVMQRLKEANHLSGIVCYNDEIANTIYSEIIAAGYSIPEDYSIIGNDHSPIGLASALKLSTIEHPKEKLGIDAADWIIQTIQTNKEQPSIVYAPKLVLGETIKNLTI